MSTLSLISSLMVFWGGSRPSDDLKTLRATAQDLLAHGQANKALVVLRRARALDSIQTDVDRLVSQCRAAQGKWVNADVGSNWIDTDDGLEALISKKPDSMALVARGMAKAEDLPGALGILGSISRSHASNPAYLKAYGEVLAQQGSKVAFHRELAQKAFARGAVSEASFQWHMALSARPDDPLLREFVDRADLNAKLSLQVFLGSLERCLAARDDAGALAILAKTRIAHPEEPQFQRLQDSLKARRKTYLALRLLQIDTLADSGRDREASDAMEWLCTSNPDEPALSQAQDALQDRLVKRRNQKLDEVAAKGIDDAFGDGDVSRADALLQEMVDRGARGAALDRLRQRIDSAHAVDNGSTAFNEALSNSRRSLLRGDTISGRKWVQKALSVRPDNQVAKGILANLASSAASESAKPVVTTVRAESVTNEDLAKTVNDLVLSGISAYRGGEYQKAMEHWKQALALDPHCAQAQKYLANVGRKQARLK